MSVLSDNIDLRPLLTRQCYGGRSHLWRIRCGVNATGDPELVKDRAFVGRGIVVQLQSQL